MLSGMKRHSSSCHRVRSGTQRPQKVGSADLKRNWRIDRRFGITLVASGSADPRHSWPEEVVPTWKSLKALTGNQFRSQRSRWAECRKAMETLSLALLIARNTKGSRWAECRKAMETQRVALGLAFSQPLQPMG